MAIYTVKNQVEYSIPRYALISLSLLWGVYIFHAIITPMRGELFNSPIIRTPLIIIISIINIIIIPHVYSIDEFLACLSITSVFVVLLGLPTFFVSYSILGIEFAMDPGVHEFINIELYSSLFVGPNSFSRYVLAGTISSLVLIMLDRRYITLFSINVVGILLASSRATMGVTVVSIILFLLFLKFGRYTLYIVSALGGLIIFTLILAISGIVPAPGIIIDQNLSRRILWSAGIEAWKQNPLIGTGPIDTAEAIEPFLQGTRWPGTHVHNSYLRILITTGLVGLIPYIYFHIRSIISQILLVEDIYSLGILLIGIAYTANQATNVFSLFGLSATSVIVSITFGFMIFNITQSNIEQYHV